MDVHDGLLYEAGGDFIHRLEAASLGETSGQAIWQYVGSLTPWSRVQLFTRELVEEGVASFACGGAINVACGVNFVLDRSGRDLPEEQLLREGGTARLTAGSAVVARQKLLDDLEPRVLLDAQEAIGDRQHAGEEQPHPRHDGDRGGDLLNDSAAHLGSVS